MMKVLLLKCWTLCSLKYLILSLGKNFNSTWWQARLDLQYLTCCWKQEEILPYSTVCVSSPSYKAYKCPSLLLEFFALLSADRAIDFCELHEYNLLLEHNTKSLFRWYVIFLIRMQHSKNAHSSKNFNSSLWIYNIYLYTDPGIYNQLWRLLSF